LSELVYRIEGIQPTVLLVRVEEKGSKRVLYLDTLKNLAREVDKEVLNFLIKIHLRAPNVSRSSDTASFQQIAVPAAQSNEAIRLMAKTKKLYTMQNLPVVVNPIAAKIFWKGEKHSECSCTLEAFFDHQPLSSVNLLFPGDPYWMLQNGVWSSLSTDLPWKWIELFRGGPILLEGSLQKRFFEENPSIVWAKKEEKNIPFEVFPQLVLQDATGCFAHLWMDYSIGKVAFEDLAPAIGGKSRLRDAELLWEKDLLETHFVRKAVGATRYFCPSDKVQESLCFLLEIGWRIFDCKGRSLLRQTSCDLSIQENEQQIAIAAVLRFQDKSVPLGFKKLQRLWLELDDHSVGLIDPKMVHPVESLLQEGIFKEEKHFLPRQKMSALIPWLDEPGVDWGEQLKTAVGKLSGGIEEALPGTDFQGTLLPYQQTGVDWLQHLYKWGFSGLLADEMGLGKTVQVLAFFSRLGTKLPVLIIAPTSLLFNWSREFARFLPTCPVYIHAGPDRLKNPLEIKKFPWIITSYAVLRLDEEWLKQIDFEVILLDESQAIKNAETQTALAVSQLQGRFRVCLSGTPIENRAEELLSQFQFLLPRLLSKSDPVDRLKRKIRPFFLRRRKQDVDIQLPEKIEQIVWIEMNRAQQEMYEAYKKGLKGELFRQIETDGAAAHRMAILEAILRLRQICCDPRLVGGSDLGAKLELLKTDVEEVVCQQRKILIYSQFTSMLSLIRRELTHLNPLYLDGSMNFEERGRQVQAFQEDPNALIFLVSLKAGGSGLNLTAAEYVLLFDPWWNESVERQAIDRAHRMGQKKKILAKRYLIPNSIEEKMLELKKKKQAAADHLLDEQEGEFSWKTEDLLHLLF
jgi:superfamily II DNA or RNA helicase